MCYNVYVKGKDDKMKTFKAEAEKAPRIITIKSAEVEDKLTDVFKTNSDQFKIIKVGA